MNLEVGDRINVYGAYQGANGVLLKGKLKRAIKGTVLGVDSDSVSFQTSDWCIFTCHIKQVRKIKKRKMIWVNEYNTLRKAFAHYTKEEADREAGDDRVSCTEFVEVRKK